MSKNLQRSMIFVATGIAMGVSILVGTPDEPKQTVPSRDPVRTEVVECQAEDGGPVLPCIWKDKDVDGNYILFTK